jgi:hypothetical protein
MSIVDVNRLKGNQAEAIVSAWLSATCLVRPVSGGTDVGIDLYCESILGTSPFLHFWVQVKAIPAASIVTEGGKQSASFRFDRKHLEYWDRQPIPVYALLVPFDGWPSPPPATIFGIRITENLVRYGIPDSATTVYRTVDGFAAASLESDLHDFVNSIVPWDTAALLLKRGIVAPIPKREPSQDEAFAMQIGFQYLPLVLKTIRDASVHGLYHALLGERHQQSLRSGRGRFQLLAEVFEDEMHDFGLSMLVRAAHTDGDVVRAKGYIERALSRIAADDRVEPAARLERIAKLTILLRDFE